MIKYEHVSCEQKSFNFHLNGLVLQFPKLYFDYLTILPNPNRLKSKNDF